MENEDNFKCNLCNNAYKYEGTLKTHIMVKHCKSNSYNCNQCEYHRSSVYVDLETSKDPASKGIKSDTGKGENQMRCNQSESFSIKTASNLNEDLGEEEPSDIVVNNKTIEDHGKTHDETTLICNQCEFTSSQVGTFETHLKTHSGEKSNKCSQCNYASYGASNLKRHLKTHSHRGSKEG